MCWGKTRWEKIKEHRSITQSKTPTIYVINPNWEKSRSRTQIYYYQRYYKRRRENLTAAMFFLMAYICLSNHNPNEDTSFIEKTKLTSCELSKLPLTRNSSFTSHEAFKLDSLAVVQIWDASLHCSFGVLLQRDAKLLLRSNTPTLPITWNFELAQPLSGSDCLHFGILKRLHKVV